MKYIMSLLLALAVVPGLRLEAKAPAPVGKEIVLSSGTGRIYVSLPEAGRADGRAVVLCPGGRYGYLELQNEGFDWVGYLNSMGCAAIVLRYTMPAGDPSKPVRDAEEAVALVRRHASEWGIRPDAVGIFGFSAGGHLASYVATNSRGEARPDFQCLFYPVVTMDSSYTHMPSRNNLIGPRATAADVRRYSNELNVDSTSPRAFIVANEDDVKVPARNAISYYLALMANGVPAALYVYPTGAAGACLREPLWQRHGALPAPLARRAMCVAPACRRRPHPFVQT